MDRSTSLWLGVVSFGLLGAVALFSCVPHIEEDIATRAGEAVGFPPWLEIDVDGQELVLRGEAPGVEAREDVLERLQGLDGVTVLHDAMSLAAQESQELAFETPSRAEPVDVPVALPRVEVAPEEPAEEPEEPVEAPEEPAEVPEEPAVAPEGQAVAVQPAIEQQETADPPTSDGNVVKCQEALDRLLEGQRINFAFASVKLAQDSHELLQEIADQAAACAVHIEISGHTDSSGEPAHNRMLSKQRAQSVVNFLVAAGVDARQLSAVGYGDARPIASNDTRRGRRANRRIEFRATIESSGDADSRAKQGQDA